MKHTDWNDLSQAVRDLIEAHTGPVREARTVTGGLNSQLAAVLDTADGPLFVKGLRTDHPGVVRQQREAMINPYVLPLAPQLRWQAEGAGWNLLAFAYIVGARHADYSPGSADLPAVVQVINRLQQIRCPDLPVKRAEQRWAAYVDDDTDPGLLAGRTLLHTDFNPLNVLMTTDGAWIIDWAWPTRGAAFIDPACFLLRLMLGGHTAAQAEPWAAQCTSWGKTPHGAINVFAIACARLYDEIARDDPQPWKRRFAAVAQDWAEYRSGSRACAR
ncbi:MAG TPA: phosphotransferase [Streptosporangiaceae bacterium]